LREAAQGKVPTPTEGSSVVDPDPLDPKLTVLLDPDPKILNYWFGFNYARIWILAIYQKILRNLRKQKFNIL
jgi:hypothetical protein